MLRLNALADLGISLKSIQELQPRKSDQHMHFLYQSGHQWCDSRVRRDTSTPWKEERVTLLRIPCSEGLSFSLLQHEFPQPHQSQPNGLLRSDGPAALPWA